MKSPYLSGMLMGGLVAGGVVLLTSPSAGIKENSSDGSDEYISARLQDRMSILKAEVDELIVLGESIAEEVKDYLKEKIPPLVSKIEELTIVIKDRYLEVKEILLDLIDRLWNMWEKKAYAPSK